MTEPSTSSSFFVAASATTAQLYSIDKGPTPSWKGIRTGQQDSVAWLRNGRAFIATQPGAVVLHVLETKADTEVLQLPTAGELLARVSGDGKSLILANNAQPGTLLVYDLPSLLANKSPGAAAPRLQICDHERPIIAIAVSPLSAMFASSNAAGSVYVHDSTPGARANGMVLPGGSVSMVTPKRCLSFSNTNPQRSSAAALQDSYVTAALNVKASCMAVRDDGLVAAIGTKDGLIGVFMVDDFINNRQKLVSFMRSIRNFNMQTQLPVSDIAFQRVSPRVSGAGLMPSGHLMPPLRLPTAASAGGLAASAEAQQLRSILDDFRQEVRSMFEGLHADMMRQGTTHEVG
ncbi:hypothetical protein GPECTOR_13g624 [Gonium pectorale]|uniref:Anaphase-promoting complex subunit 4 WD40 domain-containing protein n=1 Tax=Gonium pectorale TaxID=33097 RepID=A0A150GMV0_GONPE|nr:hypothetical protein GPECTOR_13g624 [Gonium pectorale]|eukprot:KXZ51137.1 hypothetical protein GPECTOR_13g624 [Gonium pectorale]